MASDGPSLGVIRVSLPKDLVERVLAGELTLEQAKGIARNRQAAPSAPPTPETALPAAEPESVQASDWLQRHHPNAVHRIQDFPTIFESLSKKFREGPAEADRLELNRHAAEWYLDAARLRFALKGKDSKVPAEHRDGAESVLRSLENQHKQLVELSEKRR